MKYVLIGLAAIGAVNIVLPDFFTDWIFDLLGWLLSHVSEPFIKMLSALFDGVREAIQHIFF